MTQAKIEGRIGEAMFAPRFIDWTALDRQGRKEAVAEMQEHTEAYRASRAKPAKVLREGGAS